MYRCKSCGKFFRLKKENRYEVIRPTTIAEALNGEVPTILECFDCPRCGCQNMLNVREGGTHDDKTNG